MKHNLGLKIRGEAARSPVGRWRRVWGLALLGCLAALLVFGAAAYAQTAGYTLDWFTVDSGGAVGTSPGGYTLSGTTGQPDAGAPVAGGGYRLAGGFWYAPPAEKRVYLPMIKRP